VNEVTTAGFGAPTVYPDPSSAPCLILISSSQVTSIGKVFRMCEPETVVGRGSGAQCRVWDPGVSRQHAKVVRGQDGTYVLIDLGSTNGTYINGLRVKSSPLRDGDKIQIGTVTGLKFSARPQLEEGEERLRRVLVASGVGTWEWERRTRKFTFSDSKVAALEGLSENATVRRRRLWSLLGPAERRRVRRALALATRKGIPVDLELRIDVPGNPPRWISMRGDVFRNESGVPTHVAGTLVDVTSRILTEQELRRQALLFECLSDGVVVFDLAGAILDWNRAAQQILGHDRESVLGRPIGLVLNGRDDDALTGRMLGGLAGEGRWSSELSLRRKDGSECVAELTAVPLRDSESRSLGGVALLRDVGEQRAIQEQLILADRLASLGTLAAGVAHEINNPLAYVLANIDCIAGQLASFRPSVDAAALDEAEAELADVRVGAERIRSIVQDLNTFSRGSRPDEMSPVDVKRSIEFALKVAGNEIRHRARIVAELVEVPPVLGSEARLAQVFLNLLLNAAHAIPEGAAGGNEVRVVVRVESALGRVVVEISDTGPAIPEQELSHLFEPFFAGKSTGRGAGFGLPISLGTVRAMGGDLSVENRPGTGTLFRVALPVEPRSRRPAPPEPKPDHPASRGNILVIDDEPRVAAAIQRCLSARHEVSVAASAADALHLLGEGARYDAVVCDLMMPDMSGMEFYAELEARLPDLAKRVVFMTGGAFTPRAQQFLSRVESRCIGKPIDFAALEAMVAGLMG